MFTRRTVRPETKLPVLAQNKVTCESARTAKLTFRLLSGRAAASWEIKAKSKAPRVHERRQRSMAFTSSIFAALATLRAAFLAGQLLKASNRDTIFFCTMEEKNL